MNTTGSILILSPWPSIHSMQGGGGTPLGTDLLEALLAAGYSVDLVVPESGEQGSVPLDKRVRVHRYRQLGLTFEGNIGRVVAWVERTLRLTACGLIVSARHGRPRVIYAFSALA